MLAPACPTEEPQLQRFECQPSAKLQAAPGAPRRGDEPTPQGSYYGQVRVLVRSRSGWWPNVHHRRLLPFSPPATAVSSHPPSSAGASFFKTALGIHPGGQHPLPRLLSLVSQLLGRHQPSLLRPAKSTPLIISSYSLSPPSARAHLKQSQIKTRLPRLALHSPNASSLRAPPPPLTVDVSWVYVLFTVIEASTASRPTAEAFGHP